MNELPLSRNKIILGAVFFMLSQKIISPQADLVKSDGITTPRIRRTSQDYLMFTRSPREYQNRIF